MTTELSLFAARLREHIDVWSDEFSPAIDTSDPGWQRHADIEFSGLAVMLFTLQFKYNTPYRRLCESRGIAPSNVMHWTQIPAMPTAAFKEFELSCLHPEERTRVFHSSGTTEQRPSRHFHSAKSLALYEASLWPWFQQNLPFAAGEFSLVSLTPPADQVPHSSLVHMFDHIAQRTGNTRENFVGSVGKDGAWNVEANRLIDLLRGVAGQPVVLVGTAFSFVHLLDFLAGNGTSISLPPRALAIETGGYKGRSRVLPKAELHQLIAARLGISKGQIRCEYGMSELSSQAYDRLENGMAARAFQFPPWARARVVSPENGLEVGDGEIGLLQVFDLANAFSVMAIQTEDLARRRGPGFELIGRAAVAESRGCSLMSS